MTSWQTDTKRDMMIYRCIELSVNLIETVLNEDDQAMAKYKEWINMLGGKSALGVKIDTPAPSLLSEIDPSSDSKIRIIAMPENGNFLIEFKTPVFETTINLIYDFSRYDISAASIAEFKGDMLLAISWAEEILEKLDEIRIKLN